MLTVASIAILVPWLIVELGHVIGERMAKIEIEMMKDNERERKED